MREGFSELEFQFALMMGYYTLFSKEDTFNLNLYLPTAFEEKSLYASDWFYESAQGVNLYLQFKKSDNINVSRKRQRSDYLRSVENIDRTFRNNLMYSIDNNPTYEFKIYKKNDRYQQHNLLHSKNSIENSIGLYVAPIFTSRFELQNNLKEWLKGKNFSSQLIYNLFNKIRRTTFRLNQFEKGFSFFKNVIYIKPHAEISDTGSHHYCFNSRRELSFHSDIVPLKRGALGFIDIMREIDSKLKKRKTSTILENADKNYQEIKEYFARNNISEIRDYKIDKLFETSIEDSENILIQLESYRKKKKYKKYVFIINQLYQDIFDIQVAFIYPKN